MTKTSIIILFNLFYLCGLSQESITKNIEVLSFNCEDEIFCYVDFDSSIFKTENLIEVNRIWFNKNDEATISFFNTNLRAKVELKAIAPSKYLTDEGDTIRIRGHATNSISFIDGQLQTIQEEEDFKLSEAALKINYFKLIKIKNGG